MIGKAVGLWAALWKRSAPRARLRPSNLVVRPFASDAPLRAMMNWRPDWKTHAISTVLAHRRGALIDVGANVGQTLLDFLSAPQRSTYVGFEPNLTCYQHLAAFIAANGLDDCCLVPAGLGDRNGISKLYRLGGDADPGGTMLRELRPSEQVHSDLSCVFRLDDIPEVLPERDIALLKIDVEGAELQALRGMEATVRSRQPWILCEVLHRDQRADAQAYRQRCSELMKLIGSLDYEVQRIIHDSSGAKIRALETVSEFPDVVWTDESIVQCDYLFVPRADAQAARELFAR